MQFRAFNDYLARNEWPKWPSSRFEMTAAHCGCGHYGSLLNPFGPRDFWHLVLTWWLGQFLVPRDPTARAALEAWQASADCNKGGVCSRAGVGAWPLHNGTLNSPLGFMFAVDRAAALQRSRRFLEAQYRMCKVGVRTLPAGMTGAGRAAFLPQPGFDYNPLVYGHVNERIPFFVFGRDFEERETPGCVFDGDHASMNCTQPMARIEGASAIVARSSSKHANGDRNSSRHAEGHGRHHAQHAQHAANRSAFRPTRAGACAPYDRSCGTTG
jgi:hypothetical protein